MNTPNATITPETVHYWASGGERVSQPGMRISLTSANDYPIIGATLSKSEATALWSALTAHFLSNPDEGSEFAVTPMPRKPDPESYKWQSISEPRVGDDFPDVGYVRRMLALNSVAA